MSLKISFFGGPPVSCGGKAYSLPFKKAEALLLYLAVEGSAPKQKIAFLLWGDKNEKKAAGNLRNALCLLRRNFPENIITNKQEIRLVDFATDADEIEKLSSRGSPLPEHIFREPFVWVDAVDRPEFAMWLDAARGKLRARIAAALRDRITACYDAHDENGAAESLSALLFFAPYDESSVLELMEIHAQQEELSKAAAIYNAYRDRVRAELGIEPSELMIFCSV